VEQTNFHRYQNDDNIQDHEQEHDSEIDIADADISIEEELPNKPMR